MTSVLPLVLTVVGFVSLGLTLVTYLCVDRVLHRRRAIGQLPPISVLKPLKGVDEQLYDNLVSFAKQDYPRFELVLGCDDIADPALELAQKLRAEFPRVAITIVAGGRPIGLNPKVNNLKQLAEAARFEHVLISDSDVRVDPQYLRAVASEMGDPAVGLVSNVISGVGERSLGASLDNLHLNTFIAGSVCGADVLAGHPCVVGKSMLFRRSEFERLGGWNAIKDVLAEDYVLGRMYRIAGYRVALCPYVVHTVMRFRRFGDFANRHIRWGQMRRQLVPSLYWAEPLLLSPVWFTSSLMVIVLDGAAQSLATGFAAASAGALFVKALADALMVRRLRGTAPRVRDVLLGLVKDWLVLAFWVIAALRTTVVWRGNLLQIGPESRLRPAPVQSGSLRARLMFRAVGR
jgi:ceramide glucosyltransferase